jgi:hypothetical protein
MTTRRLMVFTAAVAALMTAEMTRQRWVYLRRHATYHAHSEACLRIALAFALHEVEEGERLSKRMSMDGDGLLSSAQEPLHRFFDSKADYKDYLKVINLPLRRRNVENLEGQLADHAVMRQKYEIALKRLWLLIDAESSVQ